MMPFFETAFTNLAKPYDSDKNGNITETTYFDEFGTSGGLTTSVIDLLKYSRAIDRNQFVSAQTQKLIFTPDKTKNGGISPYGLGWFTQSYKGIDFYWHYGQTQGESGLFVKVPSMRLALAVLTNSVRLSSPFPLGDGDLFTSPIGELFYKYFVDKKIALSGIDFSQPVIKIKQEITENFDGDYKDFYDKEIISQATIYNSKGDTLKARDLYDLYASLNFSKNNTTQSNSIVADISHVGINQEVSKKFILKKATKLKVTGVGENCSNDLKSWCDYGWIEDGKGKIIWQMQSQPATSAGGALKNQKVETVITLPAGAYTLKYKSDWAHAYNNWDSLPPDDFVWGIVLFQSSGR
ncbi:MAG TPA: serine hydrolase, partial [Chitinophagaceae bacterium]|nr:serine hydrolase [Chitinophagaceae bacterium]